MPNFKSAGDRLVAKRRLRLFFDMRPKFALSNRFDEGGELGRLSTRLKLYPSVREIPYPAGDIEPFCDAFHGVAKAYALHVAGEQDLRRSHAVT